MKLLLIIGIAIMVIAIYNIKNSTTNDDANGN